MILSGAVHRDMDTERVGERVGNRDGENASDYGRERMGARMQANHQAQGSNNADVKLCPLALTLTTC